MDHDRDLKRNWHYLMWHFKKKKNDRALNVVIKVEVHGSGDDLIRVRIMCSKNICHLNKLKGKLQFSPPNCQPFCK
jgi:hypothetical protein